MKFTLCTLLIAFFVFSCEKKDAKINITYDYIGVKYSDSTYSKPIDSFYVKNADTLFFKKSFPITGYFKIYNFNRDTYAVGRMNNSLKEKKWLFYQKYVDNWVANEEHNYKKGVLNGRFIIYDIVTKKPVSLGNYIENQKAGKQVEYYPSGEIHSKYETDSLGDFINDYVVYAKNGDILFNAELGKEGTGYIKFYDKDNQIEWEGAFVSKKKEGLHKIYLIDSENNQVISEERIQYKNDSILSTSIVEFEKKQ